MRKTFRIFAPMTLDDFLAACEASAERHGVSRSRLSTIVFGSGVTLDRLRDGKSVTVRVLDRAIARLAEWEAAREQMGAVSLGAAA